MKDAGFVAICGAAILLSLSAPAMAQDEGRGIGYAATGPVFDLPAGMSPQQRMKDLLEEAKLADELGLDVFAIGEHHRPDYLISSPTVALGAPRATVAPSALIATENANRSFAAPSEATSLPVCSQLDPLLPKV